jgi:predicted transcriptional regulator of viral defense system
MQRTPPQLGPLETRLMAWAQMREIERATSAEIASALRLTVVQCRQLLDRMNQRGAVVQLQRGLYLLPAKLPPGGKWTPPPAVILRHLFEAKGGDWQETGACVLHFHRLTDQVANTTTVYNTVFSGRKVIAGLSFEMIKVAPARLGSVTESAGRRVPTLGRVVMDAVFDPARFGTLPRAYTWIRQRCVDETFLNELTDCSIRYGDNPTRRRLGCVLELLGVGGRRLVKLRKHTAPFRSYIPLVPGGNRQGQTNKDWGVILNQTDWLHD